MSIEHQRLNSLIEYAKQTAKMKAKPAEQVSQHKGFSLYEHQVQGLPGIHLNLGSEDDSDEIWLSVDRLHETNSPEIKSPIILPWIEMSIGPEVEPKLKESTDGASLIEAGTHYSTAKQYLTKEERELPGIHPRQIIQLADYEKKAYVKSQFQNYVTSRWQPWAEEEKKRKQTIKLYAQLFTLKQQLEGGLIEAQLELVWGIGVGIWSINGSTLSYPLLTQLSELSLNSKNAAIEIRPRMSEARIEVDWYVSNDNQGISEVEKVAKEFFRDSKLSLSPFDRGSFESLLRTAITHLDASGVYWPNKTVATDRTLPKHDKNLKITDTWVVFSRPRTNNLFIQDLDLLRKASGTNESPRDLPEAVNALFQNPSTTNIEIELPNFRGLSHISNNGTIEYTNGKISNQKDLYFPKPFNDEQVRIIQLLESSNGVVVQGPPGTGKTHTIANVICHYLANGKRVLVTSMKDPALAVLQEKLPEDIKPLAIALLTSEQEGMQQFEGSIKRIASEVQSLNQSEYRKAIQRIEESIDSLHSKLAKIDHDITQWAKRNLERISLDDECIDPLDAAHEIIDNYDLHNWMPDRITIDPICLPQFSDSDIKKLREARKHLGNDILQLDNILPQASDFPESQKLLQVHQDLTKYAQLTQEIELGNVPALSGSSQEDITEACDLLALADELVSLRTQINREKRPWSDRIIEKINRKESIDLFDMFENLYLEIKDCIEKRKIYISKPVSAPQLIEQNSKIIDAIENLISGKRAFGILKFVGHAQEKALLNSITVVGISPRSSEDWSFVKNYFELKNQQRSLVLRWNALVIEIGIDALPGNEAEDINAASFAYEHYGILRKLVKLENDIYDKSQIIIPNWKPIKTIDSSEYLDELQTILRHHLSKHRLSNVWSIKESIQKVLHNKNGKIVDEISMFLAETLGNQSIDDLIMQSKWSSLMTELARVQSLTPYFKTVVDVTQLIESSGAPHYSKMLKEPLTTNIDTLLPDNWRVCWRLKRLSTFLESIDAQDNLIKLSKLRNNIESDLAKAYQESVSKRTWLKLAENASHSVRASLQAYLNAIQKIGKGTGKRAVRYRQDAKIAASEANQAVPCWIMPHYRVSESLPPELGCFDLVIIDEASQSDLTALPALLRAKKVLIVGDDKQVSPDGVGLEEEKVRSLMSRFLENQVTAYRSQMSPERSIYDLYKVVFAQSGVMLKEHFRCISSIIEYSKREFYNHELRPLRVPKSSERLDPPLIDVLIEDGYRKSDINLPEARYIVNEIKSIASDPSMEKRSIGVVSLLGDKQSLKVWEMLEELGPEILQRHNIACGDARTFQGKERDIMFLTMVSAPNEIGVSLTRDTFAQRFNVAASRARDRMYLVRSVELEHLKNATDLRRGLIQHFSTPFAQDEIRASDYRKLCESGFEKEIYDELVQRGYWVVPQVRVGNYRIDMVVEGENDSRLAIECDGDRYHGPDKWSDDMQRQRILERAGWVFWRCFASSFVRRRSEIIDELLQTLKNRGIEPISIDGAYKSIHTEFRSINTMNLSGSKIESIDSILKEEFLVEEKGITKD